MGFSVPQIIPFLGTFAGQLLLTAGSAAIKFGLSYYQKKRAQKAARRQRSTVARDIQQNIRQGTMPRYAVFGLARVGGVVCFYEAKDKSIYVSTILSDDIIKKVRSFYVRNIEVLTTKSGVIYAVTTPPFKTTGGSYVHFEVKYGYANQTPSTTLLGVFPSVITSNHIASGVAYLISRFTQPIESQYQRVFSGSVPDVAALVEGMLIYDPRNPAHDAARSSTWKWTTNPALILLHYMTARRNGMGLSRALFDRTTFSAVADHCDATIATKYKGNRPRYEMGGIVSSDQEPAEVIEDILSTFGGQIFITEQGTFGLTCDDLDTPEIIITQDMIIEVEEAKRQPGALYEYTSVKTRFTSEDHGYIDSSEEAEEWIDAYALSRVGKNIPFEFELPFVFRHDQARRLMKKKFYDLTPEWTITFTCDFHALELFGERVFTLDYPLLGINGTFRLEGLESQDGLAKWRVSATSINPNAYQWDADLEEGEPPSIAPSTSETDAPQTPTGLSKVVGNDGGNIRAMVNWSTPPAGKTVEAQYKLTSSGTWLVRLDGTTSDNDTTLNTLTSAASYDFRVRFVDASLGVSAWATITFTATAIAGSTGPLLGLTTEGGVRLIEATVQQSNAVAAAYVRLNYVASGAPVSWVGAIDRETPSGTAAEVVQFMGLEPGDYDVYARSIGINGDLGAISGPSAATAEAKTVSTGGSGSDAGEDSGDGDTGINDGGSETTSHPVYEPHPVYDADPPSGGLY